MLQGILKLHPRDSDVELNVKEVQNRENNLSVRD